MSQDISEKNAQKKIHSLIKNNRLKEVKTLIEKNPDLINQKNENGIPPFILAVVYGRDKIVQYLIEQEVDVSIEYLNMQALHWAIYYNRRGIANFLSNLLLITNNESSLAAPAICLAAEKGYIQVIRNLLRKYPSSINKTYLNKTPLQIAKKFNQNNTVKYLLKHGADPLDLLTHKDLILFLKALGYNVNEKGHCEGFTNIIAQSTFVQYEFENCLKYLEKINNIIRKTEKEIENLKNKNPQREMIEDLYELYFMNCIRKQVGLLNDSEKYDLLAFCDGIQLLQKFGTQLKIKDNMLFLKWNPFIRYSRGLSLFENENLRGYRVLQRLEKYGSFILSKQLEEKEGLKHIIYWEGLYETKQKLPQLFGSLRKMMERPGFPHPVFFRIASYNKHFGHRIGIKYNQTERTWILVDAETPSALNFKRHFSTDLEIAKAVENALLEFKCGSKDKATLKLECDISLLTSKHKDAQPYIQEWVNNSEAHRNYFLFNTIFTAFTVSSMLILPLATLFIFPQNILLIILLPLIALFPFSAAFCFHFQLEQFFLRWAQVHLPPMNNESYQGIHINLNDDKKDQAQNHQKTNETLSPSTLHSNDKNTFFNGISKQHKEENRLGSIPFSVVFKSH